MKRQHDELVRVRTHFLVDREREGEPESAVGVRALAQELVRDVRAELMGQGLDAVVHLPEEGLVLREPAFSFVHVPCSNRSERRSFAPMSGRKTDAMFEDPQLVAILTLLLATCEHSLEAFRAADNSVDAQLVLDLEKMVERTRRELEALTH